MLDGPFKETISSLSGFVITIEIPLAVSILEPPPTATITSAPNSLQTLNPSFTFVTVGLGFTSLNTVYSIPASSNLSVTFFVNPISNKDLSVTTKTFLYPLFLISSGKTSLAPNPK